MKVPCYVVKNSPISFCIDICFAVYEICNGCRQVVLQHGRQEIDGVKWCAKGLYIHLHSHKSIYVYHTSYIHLYIYILYSYSISTRMHAIHSGLPCFLPNFILTALYYSKHSWCQGRANNVQHHPQCHKWSEVQKGSYRTRLDESHRWAQSLGSLNVENAIIIQCVYSVYIQ